jgi:SAM-dependent methyltransferase
MRNWIARIIFWLYYLRGRTPWDTNVTPPEVVHTIEGPPALTPGRALDLGCGTGTNVIYLAQHGWEVVGVDFINEAVQKARKKAQVAGVQARFLVGDVTQLEKIEDLGNGFDFVLDIGCFHSLTPDGQARYAAGLADRLRPGATYLLYAWGPDSGVGGGRGFSSEEVKETFSPHLRAVRIQHGEERDRRSAWYWFEYSPER